MRKISLLATLGAAFLALSGFSLSVNAQQGGGGASGDVETLRQFIQRGDFAHAYELGMRHREESDGQISWQRVKNNLYLVNERQSGWPRWMHGAAQLASMLGLTDLALNYYKEFFGLYAESSYDYAVPAAKVALAREDFRLARDFVEKGLSNTKFVPALTIGITTDPVRPKLDAVKKIALTPTDVSARIAFVKDFWTENSFFHQYDETAIIFLQKTLTYQPTKEQTADIYFLMQNAYLYVGNVGGAEKYARLLREGAVGQDRADEAALGLAHVFFKQGDLRKSEGMLSSIVNSNRQSSSVPLAHLGLSEIYAKLGDDRAMVEHLKAVATFPPIATGGSIMDTSDTQQIALVRLGRYYQSKGEYETALEYFRKWEPRSWCGNELAQYRYERDLYIARCLIALGRTDEALKDHLMPHLAFDRGSLYIDKEIPELVVSIYEQKNSLAEFLAWIKPHANSEYNHAAQFAAKLASERLTGQQKRPGTER